MPDVSMNPDSDCRLCPRLAAFRDDNKAQFPDKFNAPVPGFGAMDARLVIIGLAPGLRGANFTGRPFTGDYAGDLLYQTLLDFGFATGAYKADPHDGMQLVDCRIVNAVRCVPPQNKPVGAEINTCRQFLVAELEALRQKKVIFCLGKIAHDSIIKTLGGKISAYKFTHGGVHDFGHVKVVSSYHCSRYNTNTGRLTAEMFRDAIRICQNNL